MDTLLQTEYIPGTYVNPSEAECFYSRETGLVLTILARTHKIIPRIKEPWPDRRQEHKSEAPFYIKEAFKGHKKTCRQI
jgi:hypothetical protein